MLSKARLLISAVPVLFLAAALSGCGGPEKVSVAAAVTTPASPEKPPVEKEVGAPAGGAAGIEENRTGGIADPDQVRRLENAGADGFTIGTAVFEEVFAPGRDGLAAQVQAVLDCLR